MDVLPGSSGEERSEGSSLTVSCVHRGLHQVVVSCPNLVVELAFLSRKTTPASLTISRPATTTTTMTTSPPDISSLTLSPQRARHHDAYDNSQFDNRYQHFQTSPAVVPSPGQRRALPQVSLPRAILSEFLLNFLTRRGWRISHRRR